MTPKQQVALDACVLLNLLATGRPLGELADSANLQFMVVAQAASEVVWLDGDDPDGPREEVDLEAEFAAGALALVTLEETEFDRFIELARVLDDGEAATLVVAESRRMAVATDDRKARRVLTTLNPQPAVTSTLAIIRAWAEGHSEAEVRACIRRVERKANFAPPRTDPDRGWWELMREEEES